MSLSLTEENYLKAIYSLGNKGGGKLSNLSIAERLAINPATVTEGLRKLSEKGFIDYNRTDGARLSKTGRKSALRVIRKHRLWETFLCQKLQFGWDEVHEIAEQLEHIQSDVLMDALDKFLGFPQFDPHGDPIPAADGSLPKNQAQLLTNAPSEAVYRLSGVSNHSPAFLRFLNTAGLALGDPIEVLSREDFDASIRVVLHGKTTTVLSREVAESLLVVKA